MENILNGISKYFKGLFKINIKHNMSSEHVMKVYKLHPIQGVIDSGEYTSLSYLTYLNTKTITTDYTLTLEDAYTKINVNTASGSLLYLPLNKDVPFPIGTQIFLEQKGAGDLIIATIPGVNVTSFESKGSLGGQYAVAALVKEDTDLWSLFGNLK